MNERIKELAKKSAVWFVTPREDLLEDFAELIVQECIQVVDGMADPEEDSDRYVWALHNASEKIREHFGVEE
jgi:hypothetical protein